MPGWRGSQRTSRSGQCVAPHRYRTRRRLIRATRRCCGFALVDALGHLPRRRARRLRCGTSPTSASRRSSAHARREFGHRQAVGPPARCGRSATASDRTSSSSARNPHERERWLGEHGAASCYDRVVRQGRARKVRHRLAGGAAVAVIAGVVALGVVAAGSNPAALRAGRDPGRLDDHVASDPADGGAVNRRLGDARGTYTTRAGRSPARRSMSAVNRTFGGRGCNAWTRRGARAHFPRRWSCTWGRTKVLVPTIRSIPLRKRSRSIARRAVPARPCTS